MCIRDRVSTQSTGFTKQTMTKQHDGPDTSTSSDFTQQIEMKNQKSHRNLWIQLLVFLFALSVCLQVVIVAMMSYNTSRDDCLTKKDIQLLSEYRSPDLSCAEFPYSNLPSQWCSTPQAKDFCFEMVASVEDFLQERNKSSIFARLQGIEPQSGPVRLWAVDETRETENSHNDLSVSSTAKFFNNSAYFYSAKMHRLSARCGGWSLSFWKTLAGKKSVQLVFCSLHRFEKLRVCSSWDV
eukprot:TRINITY_DN635_c0_g1_i1.p1 TRINITY_DN635_c0_g1~~TRINITY_DN635_c0_g1_i1.p1  ORF type:complete len:239 (-),score=39.42 TRINITY_DN635_c0_g1_i1:165-881(-)